MPTAKYDFETMVQVAKLYYNNNMNQQDIARKFGWSRSMVSMILSEAKESGIIEIKIHDPMNNDEALSSVLKEKFGLKDCIVVPTSATSRPLLTKIVAGQAAILSVKHMLSHSSVGIAWGTTCYEFMAGFIGNERLVDINVIPLIGGSNRAGSEFQLNEMVRVFAEKVHGVPSFIYAPALAESMDDKMLYMNSMYMKDLYTKWHNLDLAIIGVGPPPEYYAGQTNVDPFEMKKVYEDSINRPVGDIVARRITFSGKFINSDYDSRIIGIEEDQLRNAKNVICVACGRHKVLSIIAALRTNTIDSFVTDLSTAELLLELLDS